MIERLTNFPENVLAFVCSGRVTKADYDTVLVPAVTDALRKRDRVRLYYATAADFSGMDPGALWADLKIGLGHLTRWERIAVVTDVEWIRHTIQFFGFLLPGTTRIFSACDANRAREWVSANS